MRDRCDADRARHPVGHLVARYGEGRLRSRIGLQLALMALAALVVLLFARG